MKSEASVRKTPCPDSFYPNKTSNLVQILTMLDEIIILIASRCKLSDSSSFSSAGYGNGKFKIFCFTFRKV